MGLSFKRQLGHCAKPFGTVTSEVGLPPFKHSLAYASGYLSLLGCTGSQGQVLTNADHSILVARTDSFLSRTWIVGFLSRVPTDTRTFLMSWVPITR